MKTQTYIVKIEMPDGDKVSPTWLKDLIQFDCDVEDSGRQIVSVSEVIESKALDEAAEEYGRNCILYSPEWQTRVDAFKAGAKWMVGQGYNQNERVYNYNGEPDSPCVCPVTLLPKEMFKNGDKVIVQIRKI